MRRLITTTIAILGLAMIATACANNVFDLEVGQCFDDPDDFEEVANVNIVDCAEPHDNEIYHLFDLPEGDFPGQDAVLDMAADGCISAFDAYVGRDFQSSALNAQSLNPSEQSWNEGDDREVVCFLYDLELAKLTGSMRNSGV